ncbi:hypothetical protein BJ684DRAFT_14884 [Piptocephalis cylindrospora]|uniref:Uncharacterized protein n=1 Tax=Piptocephalis cylindrospora TaxID=1907219 RepID=A0A4P9Y7T5_9FUNG|nr:hypothetical protein BJ684DRAFT_14884 [Piptocephalis cylindrospora]|eukprot:RKP14814.1 hypothetical protein BJ684DRAFT_14884 [Piptocephalis cylindrospora]
MHLILPTLFLLAASSGHAMDPSIRPKAHTEPDKWTLDEMPYLPTSGSSSRKWQLVADLLFSNNLPDLPKDVQNDSQRIRMNPDIPVAYAYLLTLWGLATEIHVPENDQGYVETTSFSNIFNSLADRVFLSKSCNALFPPSRLSSSHRWLPDPLHVDKDKNGFLSRICAGFKLGSKSSSPLENAPSLNNRQWMKTVFLFSQKTTTVIIMEQDPNSETFQEKDSLNQLDIATLKRELQSTSAKMKHTIPMPTSPIFLRTVIKILLTNLTYSPQGSVSSEYLKYISRLKKMVLVAHLRFWESSFPNSKFGPAFKALVRKINKDDPSGHKRQFTMHDASKAIYATNRQILDNNQRSRIPRKSSAVSIDTVRNKLGPWDNAYMGKIKYASDSQSFIGHPLERVHARQDEYQQNSGRHGRLTEEKRHASLPRETDVDRTSSSSKMAVDRRIIEWRKKVSEYSSSKHGIQGSSEPPHASYGSSNFAMHDINDDISHLDLNE